MNTARFATHLKVACVSLLILVITLFHYRTSHFLISSHILFRELYFLPILLAGFWFGLRGGLTASLAVTVFYFPYILTLPEGMTGHNVGNLFQILIFNILGFIIGLLRDREKMQQKKLLEAEGLAAMGKAVSCVAHDMKTPLIAIGGFTRQVRRKIREGALLKKLDLIIDQVTRLEHMVGDMLAFARPLQLECTPGVVTDLIKEVQVIAAEKAAVRAVVIQTEFHEEIPFINYDPHRLHQALLNLVNNAIEASPAGGKVLIRCNCESESIRIEVADQGDGIAEEHQANIFTPFVTTKKEGTGLGLPIVKKIVEAHTGAIGFRMHPEAGTVFHIILPVKRSV